jgi:ribonuclease P protein component
MGEAPVPAEQPPPGQAPRVPSSDVDPGRAGDHRQPQAQGPSSPLGLIQPIRDRATFLRLRRSGRRVRRGPVTVTWVPGEPSEPTRVAYTVGRKVGGAVVRNRVRRRLRAVASERPTLLRPGAYLIGAGPEAAPMPYRELRAAVHEALSAVAQPRSRPAQDRR